MVLWRTSDFRVETGATTRAGRERADTRTWNKVSCSPSDNQQGKKLTLGEDECERFPDAFPVGQVEFARVRADRDVDGTVLRRQEDGEDAAVAVAALGREGRVSTNQADRANVDKSGLIDLAKWPSSCEYERKDAHPTKLIRLNPTSSLFKARQNYANRKPGQPA